MGDQSYIKEDGYASFRLLIYFNKDHHCNAVSIKFMNTAYRLYINKIKIMENGKVGQTEKETTAEYKPLIQYFFAQSDIIEMILEIANYEHKHGGPINSIIIGKGDTVERELFSRHFIYISFFGFFIIISFYYIIIFLANLCKKKVNLTLLFFSFFCFLNTLKIIATEKYIITFFPSIYSFVLNMKLGYFSYYCSVPIYLLFIYFAFYTELVNRKIKLFFYLTFIIGFSCTILVLGFQIKIFQSTFMFYNVFALTTILITLFIMGKVVFKEGKYTSQLIFWGTVVLYLSGLNDIIYDTLIKYGIKWVNYLLPGGSVFIILLNYILDKEKKLIISNNEITKLNKKIELCKNIYSIDIQDEEKVKEIYDLIEKQCKKDKINLTKKEKEVLFHKILVGGTNKVMAERLNICEGTLKQHWNKVIKKCGLKEVIEFLRFIFRDI